MANLEEVESNMDPKSPRPSTPPELHNDRSYCYTLIVKRKSCVYPSVFSGSCIGIRLKAVVGEEDKKDPQEPQLETEFHPHPLSIHTIAEEYKQESPPPPVSPELKPLKKERSGSVDSERGCGACILN